MSNIKKNFFYSTIITVSNYIFPLFTFPYISRVLGVNNVGICNYIDSIIQYIVLFSLLGTTFVGIREIASVKNDKEKLNITFSSIITLNIITTTIGVIVILCLMFLTSKFADYKILLLIGIIKLLGTVFAIDWLYKGIEDFKYITQRTIIVKLFYVASIFLFIKNEDDYIIYFILTTMMYVVNTVINCIHATTYVSLRFKHLKINYLIKPYIILGLQAILTSMYTSFNVAFLGYVTDTTQVGYYTTATKLFNIILSVYSAFTGVMVPRMSSLVAQNHIEEFKLLLKKSLNLLFSISVPFIIYTITFCDDIIYLIAGNGYEGAITPARIVMPLILIIGYEQILVIQTLMPLKADKELFYNSIIGATVGILMNILIVSKLESIGSALVWLISELSVLTTAQYYVYKRIKIGFPIRQLIKQIIVYIPLFFPLFLIHLYKETIPLVRIILSTLILCTYFLIVQYFILKNQIIINIISKFNFFKNNKI